MFNFCLSLSLSCIFYFYLNILLSHFLHDHPFFFLCLFEWVPLSLSLPCSSTFTFFLFQKFSVSLSHTLLFSTVLSVSVLVSSFPVIERVQFPKREFLPHRRRPSGFKRFCAQRQTKGRRRHLCFNQAKAHTLLSYFDLRKFSYCTYTFAT